MEIENYKNRQIFGNWSKLNFCIPKYFSAPDSIPEVRRILKICKKNAIKIRFIGSLLSPSDLPMTNEFLVSTKNLNKLLLVDKATHTVRVQSGMQYKNLLAILEKRYGMALPIIGSITDQTIGGLIGTGVHGTGKSLGSFCSLVTSLRLMKHNGQIISLKRESDDAEENKMFRAVLIGLGCFGIVLDVTLQAQPLFFVRSVQRPVKLSSLYHNLTAFSAKYEYFRAWIIPHCPKAIVWYAERIDKDSEKMCEKSVMAKVFERFRAMFSRLQRNLFEFGILLGKAFPSIVPLVNRLHFEFALNRKEEKRGVYHELFTFDCLFQQRVDEWAVDIERTETVIGELMHLINTKYPQAHLPIEIRFTARDEAWLSPSNRGAVCYIGVICYFPYGIKIDCEEYFQDFENVMKKNNGRPHWAKTFNVDATYLREVYVNWEEWMKIRAEMDPDNLFANEWTKKVLKIEAK